MKQIDTILHRVSILYYIFLIVTIIGFTISFVHGFVIGFGAGNQTQCLADKPLFDIIIFVTSQLLVLATSCWALVLFIRMLILIWRSIRQKDIFNPKIVKIMRRFIVAYLILAMASAFGFLSNMYPIEMETAEVLMGISSAISTVIILLMLCEILKIGNILKAEQDLTV